MAAPVLQFKRGLLANLPGLRVGEPGFTTDSYDLYVGIDSSANNNKFFGSHRYWTKGTASTGSGVNLVEGTSNGTSYVTLKSPDSLAGIVTYTLPGTQGTTSSVLTNDGSGNLTWSSGSANPVFSGIATFSDTTDNTLGDADTGAVQINGGLGINKNVTVGGNLNVQGYSEFVGVVTFKGGTINLGDNNTDDIVFGGEIKSNIVPTDDATYDIGIGGKRWRHASFSGIGTFATGLVADNVRLGIGGNGVVDTTTGALYLDSASGNTIINDHVDILGDLDVTGNVYIGGTTVTLRGTDVFIENKDIVLGYTTSVTPNDTTANHAGVAIASTEGSPLVNFEVSGINTLPNTYKQMMWFKSGTLGFSTDAFGFNYGVAIGTTTMANGVRLAVGSGVTMSDTSVSATTFYGSVVGNVSSANQVKTVTASDTNANYYVTFVDANNGSATNESVYTDDGIYYNPGTNTFTTQYGIFTGSVGIGTTNPTTKLFLDGAIGFTNSNIRIGSNQTSPNVTGSSNISIGDYAGNALTAGTRNVLIGDYANAFGSNGSYNVMLGYKGSTQGSHNIHIGELHAGGSGNYNVVIGNGDAANNYNFGVPDSSKDVQFAVGINTTSSNPADSKYWIIGNENFNVGIGTINPTSKLTVGGDGYFSGNVTFAQGISVTGITTTGTLKLAGTSGIGITGISASTTLAENSDNYLPTQKAVKAYVDAVDLTLGLNADSGGPSTVNTSQTLTISGTASEVETSVSGQTVTIGLPNAVVVGTSLSAPTIRTGTIQSSNTGATAITLADNDVTITDDLTVQGNLYVNGNTTQVNTSALTVEDRTIDLGIVNGSAPASSTTWDLGILFNYNSSGAKKSAVIWEHGDTRFKFASVLSSDTNGSDADTPQLTVTTFAPIEIGSLWVTDCAGTSQVISCTGTTRNLENITIDGGSF